MIRSFAVLSAAAIAGCSGMMVPENIEITVTPRTLINDGSAAKLRVLATDSLGNVGSGSVRVKSSAGSLVSGETVTLDAYGTATLEFTCNVADDVECKDVVTFSAEWARPKNMVVKNQGSVRIGMPVPDAGMPDGGSGPLDVLMVGTTNGALEMGLGAISATPAAIRTGISTKLAVNASGATNEKVLLSANGDLVYMTVQGMGPNGVCTTGTPCTFDGFRIFRANGTDDSIQTTGCPANENVSFFDSPTEGLLYSCVQNQRLSIFKLDGTASEWMQNTTLSGGSAPIVALGRAGLLIAGPFRLFASPTAAAVTVLNAPAACDVVTATGMTFLCLSQSNRVFRFGSSGATDIGGYNFGEDFGFTTGTLFLNAAFGADGSLFRGRFLSTEPTSPAIVVRYGPPSSGTGSVGRIVVDSRNAVAPSGPNRTFMQRYRVAARNWY